MTEIAEEFIVRKKKERTGEILQPQKDVSGEAEYVWKIEAVTLMQETNNPNKVYECTRERLVNIIGNSKLHPKLETRVRLSYWIIAKKGIWIYGQFSPTYFTYEGENDLIKLIEKAKEEGTI